MKFLKPYLNVWKSLKEYWRIYGGITAVLTSPYFHIAVLVVALSDTWRQSFSWAEDTLSIVPSILGFSLGAFTIFLAFSDQQFVAILMKRVGPVTGKSSSFLKISSLFIHFMIVQVAAIMLALVSRNLSFADSLYSPTYWVSCFGYFFTVYALFSTVATALALLRLAVLYNKFKQLLPKAPNSDA